MALPNRLRSLLDAVRRRWTALGALSVRVVMAWLIGVFSAWVLTDVLVLKVTSGLANSTYDAMVRSRLVVAAPDPRLLIVDIDEASLLAMGKEFGRWPWPRDTLATVLDFLEKQQPAAIVWDIAFSDADRLSPGGDKAFDEAVRRSAHSHFSVVRLPVQNDGASRLGPAHLPTLWQGPAAAAGTAAPGGPTAALIVPVLPSVAASRLGYNNGYPDADGVLRRYRFLDEVSPGWALKSIPYSVAEALDPKAAAALETAYGARSGQLIAWRGRANSYPRVSFFEVFAAADGGKAGVPLPDFKGRVIVIGSTAPSLHDIHPTPLAPLQAGVDSLATAIDNALNQRHISELPRWLQAVLAIVLCVGIALWVRLRGMALVDVALVGLPVGLLVVSYASLNGMPMFVDLYLPAALVLAFLAALRYWNNLRRSYWCDWRPGEVGADVPLALWACRSRSTWAYARLDRLIDVVAGRMPECRIVVAETNVTWPAKLHWPELASYAAIVGPQAALLAQAPTLDVRLGGLAAASAELGSLPLAAPRKTVAASALRAWTQLDKSDDTKPLQGALP